MVLDKPKADEWTMMFTNKCIHCGDTGYVRVKKKDEATWKYTSRYLRPLVQDLFPYIHKDWREQIMTGTHPRCFIEMFGDEEDNG
tara:strand:+ start:347 stop:601 length:255 start_codon:yes stop_codon:yes gene_type:complete